MGMIGGSRVPATNGIVSGNDPAMGELLATLQRNFPDVLQSAPAAAPGDNQSGQGARAPMTGMFGRGAALSAGLSRDQVGPGIMGAADAPVSRTSPDLTPVAMQKIRPHFFESGGLGSKILKGLGEFALAYSAGEGNPAALTVLRQRMADRDAMRELAVWRAQQDYQRSAPQFFSGNESRLRLDPTTGSVQTIYQAPTDAERYAKSLGLQPGSPAYQAALKDYDLKGYGPTMMGFREQQEGNDQAYRTAQLGQGRERIDIARANTGIALRNSNISAANASQVTPGKVVGPILAKMSRGEALTPAEQATLNQYRPMSLDAALGQRMGEMFGQQVSETSATPAPAAPRRPVLVPRPTAPKPRNPTPRPAVAVGQTATGPGGKRIRWNGQRWVPLN